MASVCSCRIMKRGLGLIRSPSLFIELQQRFFSCKPSSSNSNSCPLLMKLLQLPNSLIKTTLDSSLHTFPFKTFDSSWDALVTALCSSSPEKARLVIEWRLGKMLDEDERDHGQYSSLISLCGKIRNVPLAMRVFTSMEAQGVKPTSSVFNSLINACLASGRVTTALSLFEIMESSESYKRNPETYDTFILAFSNMRNADAMHAWYSAKKAVGFSTSLQNFESLIVASVKLRDFGSADKIYKEMESSGTMPNALILENMLEGLCRRKSSDRVKEFLKCFLDGGLEITVNMVDRLVGFYSEFRYVEEMEELLAILMEAEQGSEVLSRVHCGLIRLYAMLDRLDDVEYSVGRMMNQGMPFKCPDDVEKVICSYFRQAAYDRLQLFLEHIKSSYKLTRSNYDLLVAGYKRAGLSEKLDSVMIDMKLAKLS